MQLFSADATIFLKKLKNKYKNIKNIRDTMQLFSADATIFLKRFKIVFWPLKT